MQQRQSNAKDGTGFLRALGPLSWSAPTWAHQWLTAESCARMPYMVAQWPLAFFPPSSPPVKIWIMTPNSSGARVCFAGARVAPSECVSQRHACFLSELYFIGFELGLCCALGPESSPASWFKKIVSMANPQLWMGLPWCIVVTSGKDGNIENVKKRKHSDKETAAIQASHIELDERDAAIPALFVAAIWSFSTLLPLTRVVSLSLFIRHRGQGNRHYRDCVAAAREEAEPMRRLSQALNAKKKRRQEEGEEKIAAWFPSAVTREGEGGVLRAFFSESPGWGGKKRESDPDSVGNSCHFILDSSPPRTFFPPSRPVILVLP